MFNAYKGKPTALRDYYNPISPHKLKRNHFDFEWEPWSLSPVVLN